MTACGAPLSTYSRFRTSEPSDRRSLVVLLVVVLAAALLICWCNKKMKKCGCGRSGRRAYAGRHSMPVELESYDDFKEATKELCVVMCYAEWCGHCKHTKPVFSDAAPKASCPFYLVDCEKVFNQQQMQTLGIQGFPTILRMVNGEVVAQFAEERTVENFVQFGAQ